MTHIHSIEIHDSWVDLNTLTGIDVGTPVSIHNHGEYHLWVQENATAPTEDNDGFKIGPMGSNHSVENILNEPLRIWVRCVSPNGTTIGVQDISNGD